ncbi:MAG TPA: hypothetical protein PLH70_08260 [Bacteroidales bacterium]|nr:hypothetical protein [Bacteroidales bacterium]HPZ04119.1 hypothetical protein [Bacteroidales bacterium]HQB75777.1 hypothetical protein [Bacteroidales bacterium]
MGSLVGGGITRINTGGGPDWPGATSADVMFYFTDEDRTGRNGLILDSYSFSGDNDVARRDAQPVPPVTSK